MMTNHWIDNIREEHRKFERMVSKVTRKRYSMLKFPGSKDPTFHLKFDEATREPLTDIEERWYINRLLYRDLLQFQKEEEYSDGEMITALFGILCAVIPLERLKLWLSEYERAKERERESE